MALERNRLPSWESDGSFIVRSKPWSFLVGGLGILGIVGPRLGAAVEGWGQHDRLGHLQQLGVIPGGEQYRGWVREKLSGAT